MHGGGVLEYRDGGTLTGRFHDGRCRGTDTRVKMLDREGDVKYTYGEKDQ